MSDLVRSFLSFIKDYRNNIVSFDFRWVINDVETNIF